MSLSLVSHTFRIPVFSAILIIVVVAPRGDAQWDSNQSASCAAPNSCQQSQWRFGAKALFLDRVDDNGRLFSGPNGNFDSAEIGLDFQAGYQIDGRFHLDTISALTIRWMSIDRWRDDHRDLVGPAANVTLNSATLFNFTNVTYMTGVRSSDLNSFELGISRQLFAGLNFTGGFRYLEIDDQLGFALDSGGAITRIATTSQNRLYGGQVGLESRLLSNERYSLDAFGQVGIFSNAAKQATRVDTGFVGVSSTGFTDTASFLGELGFNVRRHLTGNLDFVTGYQVMWVTAVAVASDELLAANFIAGNSIDAADSIFYHGANIGFELRR